MALINLSTKFSSSLLFLIIVHFLVWICSSKLSMLMVSRTWLDVNLQSRWMGWLTYSDDSGLRNIRLMTEFESCWLSKYLVRTWLVGLDSSKCKKSVMSVRVSQIRYSLVVILGLNSVSEVQYKDMIIDRWWKVSTGIINVVKSEVYVIATTRRNGTRSLLTSAKLSVGYLVVGIYKRTRQGALAVLPLYLYKLHVVHATTVLTGPYVHTLFSCPITHPHVFSLRLPCFLYVPWHHTLNLRCICAHHVYTMRNPCLLTSSLILTPTLDSFQSF